MTSDMHESAWKKIGWVVVIVLVAVGGWYSASLVRKNLDRKTPEQVAVDTLSGKDLSWKLEYKKLTNEEFLKELSKASKVDAERMRIEHGILVLRSAELITSRMSGDEYEAGGALVSDMLVERAGWQREAADDLIAWTLAKVTILGLKQSEGFCSTQGTACKKMTDGEIKNLLFGAKFHNKVISPAMVSAIFDEVSIVVK